MQADRRVSLVLAARRHYVRPQRLHLLAGHHLGAHLSDQHTVCCWCWSLSVAERVSHGTSCLLAHGVRRAYAWNLLGGGSGWGMLCAERKLVRSVAPCAEAQERDRIYGTQQRPPPSGVAAMANVPHDSDYVLAYSAGRSLVVAAAVHTHTHTFAAAPHRSWPCSRVFLCRCSGQGACNRLLASKLNLPKPPPPPTLTLSPSVAPLAWPAPRAAYDTTCHGAADAARDTVHHATSRPKCPPHPKKSQSL